MSSTPSVLSGVNYLVSPETAVDASGSGPAVDLGPLAGKQLLVILRITEIIEQEALDVSIWGSPDGNDWGKEPLFAYPQKFYRGSAPAAVDLVQKPEVKFLQARWDVIRWGRGYPRPYFKFTVEIQDLGR